MLFVEYSSKDKGSFSQQFNAAKCLIGSGPKADLELTGWKVQKEHAELFVSNEQVFIRDFGSMFGTQVKGKKIATYGPLSPNDEISIGQYLIKVRWKRVASGGDIHTDVAPEVIVSSTNYIAPLIIEKTTNLVLKDPQTVVVSSTEMSSSNGKQAPQVHVKSIPMSVVIDQELLGLRREVHEKLIAAFDMRRIDIHKMEDKILRENTNTAIIEILKNMPDLPKHIDRDLLLREVRDEAIGLGLLEPLLADPTTTEIMVNSVDEIFVEKQGVLQRVPLAFSSEKAVMGIIERIVAPVGRRIDESSPLVDARLKDGSRFNAIIPPLALKGPSMTIRKFSKKKLDGTDLIRFNSASHNMVNFLQLAVKQKKNIIVSGGTGSGKTTLLNILSNFIPSEERIVTIEDAAELQLDHEHLVSLEARPGNAEGKGGVSIRDLVKNSLRMRPDRIVVGECRGGEALDMLQAMNTGHDGSLTTAHANTPRDMLARVEVMVLMSGMDLPIVAIREQVASAVDIIVQQTRFACGSRKITKITEVTGVESGKIQLQDIFEYIETGMTENHKTDGYYTACDAIPEFYEKLRSIGMQVDMSIFKKEIK
jgi:pilus assembly protein CpaF